MIKKSMASLLLLSTFAIPAFSSQKVNVDYLLRHANLTTLVGTSHALNLQAQMKDPNAKTREVSDFDDFIAISVVEPLYDTMMTEFDSNQQILDQYRDESTWMGVKDFDQAEIPAMSLQDGLAALQICMAKQGDPTPAEITRIVIYKTLNTSEMIYDYVFSDPQLPQSTCQEFLYSPATGKCQKGMRVACHITLGEKTSN